jgi:hypothetical protein
VQASILELTKKPREEGDELERAKAIEGLLTKVENLKRKV